MNQTVPKESDEKISFKQELIRKATHLGALVIPGGYYLLGLEKLSAFLIMLVVSLLMFLIDVARLRDWRIWKAFAGRVFSPMIRKHELEGDFTGATYILLTSCVTIALFPKPIAIAALCFIIVGDSFAAIIGRRFGRHFFGKKSIEGSLGCLLGTVIVAFSVPDIPLSIGLLGALMATVTEAWPLGVDDNVSVPIMSGLVMTIAAAVSSAT